MVGVVSYFGTKDYGLESAKGLVSGSTPVDKFGKTDNADSGVPTDVWDGATAGVGTVLWVPPTAARVHQLASTSANDTAAGTGARTVRVWGLATWASAESSEDKTLLGTTNVATSSMVIIHRIKVLTWGSGATNAGVITATADTDGTVTAAISTGVNQTLMSIYGVPSTHTYYLTQQYGGILRATGAGAVAADVKILVKENADVANSGWITKKEVQMTNSAPLRREYSPPVPYAGPCIIKHQVESDTANSEVTTEFNGYVEAN